MSKYEVISKCISDFSLLMQSVEKIYKIYKIFKRYFIKPKYEFYENGKISLYSNFSGSYVCFKGVNKVLNTNVFIKDMHMLVIFNRKNIQIFYIRY